MGVILLKDLSRKLFLSLSLSLSPYSKSMQNFHSIPLSGRVFFTLAIPRRWHDREGDRRTLNLNQAILSVCLWSIMDCITNQIQAIHAGYRPTLILCIERYVDFFYRDVAAQSQR